MATQVVELSGDEARLLRSLQKVIDKEEAHAKKLAETGAAGDQTGKKIEGAMGRVDRKVGDTTKRGTSLFGSFGKSAVASVTSIAGGFVSVGAAIGAVNTLMREHQELLDRALERQTDLAKSQQEAAKNLAGIAVVDRSKLLQGAVPDIARETGFEDVSKITEAIGAVASAGESDPAAIANAVRQAARVSLLTPDQLGDTASNASAVQRQARLDDVRQAIALVQTTGTQSRIIDPQALAQALPKAVGSAVSTVPGQDAETAARQAAALFAQVTQGGNDEVGKSSATFTTDLTVRMQKFFVGLEDERIKARSNIELIDRKIAKGSDTERDRQRRQQALEFVKASEGVTDPGELFKRLEILQGSEALKRQFVGETGFGEKQFQTSLTALLDSNSSLTAALQESFKTIQANTEFFEREATNLGSGTPQLTIATAGSRAAAAKAAREGFDIEEGALGQVRKIFSQATTQARGSGIGDFATRFSTDALPTSLQLQGSTALEEGISAIAELQRRQVDITASGGAGTPRARELQENINALVQLVETLDLSRVDQASIGDASQRAARLAREKEREGGIFTSEEVLQQLSRDSETLTRIADLLERTANATQQTSDNTKPTLPNYGNTQRAGR